MDNWVSRSVGHTALQEDVFDLHGDGNLLKEGRNDGNKQNRKQKRRQSSVRRTARSKRGKKKKRTKSEVGGETKGSIGTILEDNDTIPVAGGRRRRGGLDPLLDLGIDDDDDDERSNAEFFFYQVAEQEAKENKRETQENTGKGHEAAVGASTSALMPTVAEQSETKRTAGMAANSNNQHQHSDQQLHQEAEANANIAKTEKKKVSFKHARVSDEEAAQRRAYFSCLPHYSTIIEHIRKPFYDRHPARCIVMMEAMAGRVERVRKQIGKPSECVLSMVINNADVRRYTRLRGV